MDKLNCWRCGLDLADLSLPLTRLEECPSCRVHLHVCRLCISYDPGITKSCSEDDAEEVRDKQAANFCDYFKPRAGAFDAALAAADSQAHSDADALFGGEASDAPADTGKSAADDLFGD